MPLVKINQNGQVSIPAKLRKELGIGPGDLVKVEKGLGGKIEITPVQTAAKSPMTPEEWLDYCEAKGVNAAALLENLARTPTERVKRNERLLELVEKFKKGEFDWK